MSRIIQTRSADHVTVREEWIVGYVRPIRVIHRMLVCPVCGHGMPEPAHGVVAHCQCGARHLRHGDRLQITLPEPLPSTIEGNTITGAPTAVQVPS